MRSYGNLHRRLADITNLDLEHSCRNRDIDCLTAKTSPRVVLTASGVHGAAKQELQRLATSIGATYSGDLVLGVTTHLICKRLIDCFGSVKYQRALEWGIHIVTYEWLEASSAAGGPLPEHDYKDDKLKALKPSPRPVRRQQQAAQRCQQQPKPAAQCPGTTRHPSAAAVPATAPGEPQAAADVAHQMRMQVVHTTPAVAEPHQQQAQQVKQHQQHQELQDEKLQQGPQHSPTQLQLSLDDLPRDFLLQGSEPEDCTAAAEVVDNEAGSILNLSLSQYSLQQHREREQQQQQPRAAMPGGPEPAFGFRQPTTPGSAEHTSPCMQHFLPMHHQQQQGRAAAERSSSNGCGIAGSEIQAVDIPAAASITACTTDGAAAQQLKRISPSRISAVVPGQCSPTTAGGPPAAAGSPVSPTATASPAPSVTSDVSVDEADASAALRLHLPETQADLEDPWGTAAASGETPIGLKFYAQQLHSKTRTAGRGAEAGCRRQLVQQDQQQAPLQRKHQQQDGHQAGGLYQQDSETDDTADDTEESPHSGSTSEDDTEKPSSGSTSELDEGPDSVSQQQHERHPAARPWSASSSTACSQQQQPPEFRLTQPSSSGCSSRPSSGLTRLKRRDGFRRLGRVLVSQLPDSTEMELQGAGGGLCANNCELEDSDCELPNSDCEVVENGLDDDILDDSDCEDIQQQQEQQERLQQHHKLQQVTSKSAGAAAGRKRQSGPTADSHSPGHSCSASSLPAHTDSKARRPASSSNHPDSPTATAAATPAASAVSGSSNGEMPVMKLHFSLTTATDVTPAGSQQGGSVYTPSCDNMSSEYSPMATTGRAEASSSEVSEHRLAGCAEEGVDKYAQEQQMQQDGDSPSVSTHSEQISGASRLAARKDTGAAAASIQLQHMQEPLPEGNTDPAGTARGSSDLSEPCNYITKRRGARGPGTVHCQQYSPAPAATVPSEAHIKQEPEEMSAEGRLVQQQLNAQQHLSAAFNPNPADAMLRAMKQQQQQQRHALKPAPIKREKLKTPAEHMLQDLRMRQQQQQHQQHAALIDPATEGIDDEADSQGHATHLAQQQQKLPRSSVASYATDISTASRKVPLKVLGVAEKVIGGDGLAGSTTPLERLLQATLVATRRESDVATAAGGELVKQEPAEWVHTPEGVGTTAAAAAAAAGGGGGGGDSEDDAFEITELPTKMVAARNKAMTKQLDAHLAHLSQAGADQVIPLKLLSKAPRGSTAKAFHDIKSSSKLVYADQVQVPWAHATLSTKEKSRCAIVADTALTEPDASAEAVANSSDKSPQDKVLLAEPVAFYKLESGEWWLELLRFYSTKELRLLAKAADCKLHLPADYHLSYELLRGMTHEHIPMKLVQGEFKLSKVKKVPSGSRSRANPFFWRYSIDLATMQVLTDRPVTDYVIQ